MRIQITSRILADTVCVDVDDDGRLVLTLEVPLKKEFERIDESFDLDNDQERIGWVEGLVLPYGYVAVGVFLGGKLQRILLSGRGISRTLPTVAEVIKAISANEAEIEAKLSGFRK